MTDKVQYKKLLTEVWSCRETEEDMHLHHLSFTTALWYHSDTDRRTDVGQTDNLLLQNRALRHNKIIVG